jgi:hypothetical protein
VSDGGELGLGVGWVSTSAELAWVSAAKEGLSLPPRAPRPQQVPTRRPRRPRLPGVPPSRPARSWCCWARSSASTACPACASCWWSCRCRSGAARGLAGLGAFAGARGRPHPAGLGAFAGARGRPHPAGRPSLIPLTTPTPNPTTPSRQYYFGWHIINNKIAPLTPPQPPTPNPKQYYFGWRIIKNKIANTPNTNERCGIIQECLPAMKLLKYYGWERFMESQVGGGFWGGAGRKLRGDLGARELGSGGGRTRGVLAAGATAGALRLSPAP